MLRGFNFAKTVVIAFAVLACVGMWGCTDVDFRWSEKRSNAKVLGFVDDSLVMVGDYRYWSEITDGWNGGYSEIEGYGHERLCVYNYRVQEEGPRWCDSLNKENETGAFIGQMTDSIIWGSGLPEKLKMWKIGEKQHEIKLITKKNGCSAEFKVSSMKQWLDGSFVVRGKNSLGAGNDSCQYAILDTIAKTITYKRLDDSLKWIQKCDDVRAFGENVYCFMPGSQPFEAVLLRNAKDSVDVPLKFTVGDFWGDVLRPNADLCTFVDDEVLCFGIVWRGGLTFYKDDEMVVDLSL